MGKTSKKVKKMMNLFSKKINESISLRQHNCFDLFSFPLFCSVVTKPIINEIIISTTVIRVLHVFFLYFLYLFYCNYMQNKNKNKNKIKIEFK